MQIRGLSSAFRWWLASLATAVLLLSTSDGVVAQPTLKDVVEKEKKEDASAEVAEAPSDGPIDELGRGTPLGAVGGFLKATRERDYEKAAEYLDLRRLPSGIAEEDGPDLARQLRIVLDRKLWIDMELLSNAPRGHGEDGLPEFRDRIGRIDMPDGDPIDILVQHVPRGDGVSIWKISSATVARIPQLWAQFGYGPLEEVLPQFLFDINFGGLRLLEWIVFLVVLGLAVVGAYIVTGIIAFILRHRPGQFTSTLATFVAGPFRLLVGVLIFSAGTLPLGFSLTARAVLSALQHAALVIALAWAGLRVLDVIGSVMMQRLLAQGQTSAIALLPAGRRAAKVVIVAITVITMLHSFGFNVTALLAGLGVGGLAVALAAQKTIENLIEGITLYVDQPVRVGDFCRFGDKIGTVEAVGLRSTRVRTLDRTVVSIPNSQFANFELDNFTKRDKIWYHPTIGLRYETTPDQLRYILVEIRKMLYAHPQVDSDPARIRFTKFAAYSLDLEIFAYVKVTDYGEFLEVAEDLNLRIMDIVAQAGSGFAFPSQTTYLENGEGLDQQRAQTAEKEVHVWREQNELLLPKFPQRTIDGLKGTLDYPPTGSMMGAESASRGRYEDV
jgi:MscS family membrane protein